MLQGPRSIIYGVKDVAAARDWYSKALGFPPYFDQPFYVGFNIGGYELGLDPNFTVGKPGAGGTVAYWRVAEIETAVQQFVAAGASVVVAPQDVGDRIKVATVADPFGNLIGLIENPHFALTVE